jgi:myosin heavy subunit
VVVRAVPQAYYSALFDELVELVNSALIPPGARLEQTSARIGLLDIFGSEVFAFNGFEQASTAQRNERPSPVAVAESTR